MKIINRRILLDFWEAHPDRRDSRVLLQTWFHLARQASWNCPEDIKTDYPGATFITGEWVSLPLKPGFCRLVMQVNCKHRLVILRHITYHGASRHPGGI